MSQDGYVPNVSQKQDGITALVSPTVGVFAPSVADGDAVAGGETIGTIEVLGVVRSVRVPDGVAGRVVACAGAGRARAAVQFGEPLIEVAGGADALTSASGDPAQGGAGAGASAAVVFVAPMSGRFYARPSPDDEPFVRDGDTVNQGQTIGLLEVMKTFNRLTYGGDGLPSEATIARVVPVDGDDVTRGDVILELK